MPNRQRLTAFTPLPPERNGIADYAATLLGALAEHYDCEAACDDRLAEAPPGVAVVDPAALAHRRTAGGRVLHQLGNNPGHGFVLQALRQVPGVTTLHDPGLLHLRQAMGATQADLRAGLRDVPRAFARYARQVAGEARWSRADHLLFDMAGEALARSRAVVVHSRFARNRLRALHGEAATSHVEVIPHLLPPLAMPSRGEARSRLGIPPDTFLVCTAGFATAAKRFDWLLGALDLAVEKGVAFRWIHAGAERPEEFPLAAAIAERPALRDRARIAGYLSEAALTDHVVAADALLNLRFPSAGESSGSLARGFAAGVCCVVSDTAGYAELPRNTVLHIPLAGAVPALAEALITLAADPARATAIGEAGRRYATAEMALPAVALRYRALIEASRDRPPVAQPPRPTESAPVIAFALGPELTASAVVRALREVGAPCRLLLAAPNLEALGDLSLRREPLLDSLLPPWATPRAVRVLEEPRAGLLVDLDCGCDG
ncbi:MAG TPA: glycosyltransferase family 4 protein [Acetobacteraceae bacterium]|nr:glycosyltransferase family 4 protein [Acetobacteraceae bacterium]